MADWGTDGSMDTTISLSGGSSFKFEATTPAADPVMQSKIAPVDVSSSGDPYQYTIQVPLRASSITSGNTLTVEWVQYEADGVTIAATTTVFAAAELDAINTWQGVGGTFDPHVDARWHRVIVTKNNTAFSAWVDRADIIKNRPSGVSIFFDIVSPSSVEQTVAAATWTKVLWNPGQSQAGIEWDSTNKLFIIGVASFYDMKAMVEFDSPSSGDEIRVRLALRNPADTTTSYFYGATLNAGGFTFEAAGVTHTMPLSPKHKVWVEVYHSAGGDILNPDAAVLRLFNSRFTIHAR